MTLQRVTRREWNAAEPKRRPRVIKASSRKGVVLHWNGPPLKLDLSGSRAALARRETAVVKAIQRFHQGGHNWSDSAYSFMVGQSGTIFEVRGDEWDQFANGADSVGPNDGADRDFYTIMVMIGEGEKPTAAAKDSVKAVVAHLRGLGAGDRVLPHNAFKRKTCPGVELTLLAGRLDRTPIAAAFASPVTAGESGVGLSEWHVVFIGNAKSSDYSAAVELWQRGLLASGFDPGPVDGLVGKKTRSANREFAAALDGPADDLPTDEMWSAFLDNMTSRPAALDLNEPDGRGKPKKPDSEDTPRRRHRVRS